MFSRHKQKQAHCINTITELNPQDSSGCSIMYFLPKPCPFLEIARIDLLLEEMMKKTISLVIGLALTASLAVAPANATSCSETDTDSVRSLFVPVIRLSAHQGRNLEENREVVGSIQKISRSVSSSKLKKALIKLRGVIEQGELNQGSTVYWGYREGSAWKTYKSALTITQKGLC